MSRDWREANNPSECKIKSISSQETDVCGLNPQMRSAKIPHNPAAKDKSPLVFLFEKALRPRLFLGREPVTEVSKPLDVATYPESANVNDRGTIAFRFRLSEIHSSAISLITSPEKTDT
jgi:hypothetical protein